MSVKEKAREYMEKVCTPLAPVKIQEEIEKAYTTGYVHGHEWGHLSGAVEIQTSNQVTLEIASRRIKELENALRWYGDNAKKIHTIDFDFSDYGKRADAVLTPIPVSNHDCTA